jgi:hypothetical protein
VCLQAELLDAIVILATVNILSIFSDTTFTLVITEPPSLLLPSQIHSLASLTLGSGITMVRRPAHLVALRMPASRTAVSGARLAVTFRHHRRRHVRELK